jgi:hypothetical protein
MSGGTGGTDYVARNPEAEASMISESSLAITAIAGPRSIDGSVPVSRLLTLAGEAIAFLTEDDVSAPVEVTAPTGHRWCSSDPSL